MRQDVRGLFGVSGCQMSRAPGAVHRETVRTNVEARCILNFITIRGPDPVRTPS